MNQARLARVLRNMERDGLTQIVISSTASVYYLTGYWVEPMERMLALYIRADGTCRLFANALFALEPQEGLELVLHQDSDVPTAALAAALLPGTLGVDKAWPSKFLIALLAARPDVTPVLGSAPVDDARKYKDADEISAMRRASQINDQVVEAAIAAILTAHGCSGRLCGGPLPAARRRPLRRGAAGLLRPQRSRPPPRPQRDGAPGRGQRGPGHFHPHPALLVRHDPHGVFPLGERRGPAGI